MSLRAFHLVFIVLSELLSFGLAGWCFREYQISAATYLRPLGIFAFIMGLGLSVYLAWFLKKWKQMGSYYGLFLVWLVGVSGEALGCSTCFANADSTLAQSTNTGVLVLLGVVVFVLCGFAGAFIYWAKRDRSYHLPSSA